MKRAVQEARELKKELVLLRQEKDEMRAAMRKQVLTGTSAAVDSDGCETARSAHTGSAAATAAATAAKTAEKKLQRKVDKLSEENAQLLERSQELERQVASLEQQNETAVSIAEESSGELKSTRRELALAQDESKKAKSATEELKRKYQKMLKEKKDEVQRALQENEQLSRCAETLEKQLEVLPQLKKQLQLAKDKSAGVSDEWQRKMEQRNEAFLQQEDANKQKLVAAAAEVSQLLEKKQTLQEHIDELRERLAASEAELEAESRASSERITKLEVAVQRLQEKRLAAEEVAKEAEQARAIAEETQAQETRLRQLAEDAADAVEIRAEKSEQQLEQMKTRLTQLENALKARGITFDYLLKAGAASDNNASSASKAAGKEVSVPTSSTKRMPGSGKSSTATATKDKPNPASSAGVNAKTPARPGAGSSLRATGSRKNLASNNNDHDEREETPARR